MSDSFQHFFYARDHLLLRMSDEDWDKVLTVNLKSVFLCTKAVLRHMAKQRWGRIISIASIVGIGGNRGQANYALAKAGIIGFTRTIAKEVASRGITANAVAPGFIDTDMTQRLKEEWKQEIRRQILLGHFGSPRDVAEAFTPFMKTSLAVTRFSRSESFSSVESFPFLIIHQARNSPGLLVVL